MTDTAWHFELNGERKGPYTLDQVRALFDAGMIGPHTQTWNPEMPGWKHVQQTDLRSQLGIAEVTPPPLAPAAPAPATAAVRRHRNEFFPNGVLVWTVQALLGLMSIFSIVIAGTGLRGNGGVSGRYARIYLLENHPLSLTLQAGVILGFFVLLLIWMYRATHNLTLLKGPQSVSPAGAVFWWFVPVAWFWKPVEAMLNLWRGFGVAGAGVRIFVWWGAIWVSFVVAMIGVLTVPDPVTTQSEAEAFIAFEVIDAILTLVSIFALGEAIKRIRASEKLRIAEATA